MATDRNARGSAPRSQLVRALAAAWLLCDLGARERVSAPATIAVTAGLFAIEHGYYPILLPPVLSFGLAAGWVRHRTHTIAVTIVMHVCIDISLFLAAALSQQTCAQPASLASAPVP